MLKFFHWTFCVLLFVAILFVSTRTVNGQHQDSGTNYIPPSARYSYSTSPKEQTQYLNYPDDKTSGYGSSDRRNYDRDGLLVSNSLLGNPNMAHHHHHHLNHNGPQMEETGISAFSYPNFRHPYQTMMSQAQYPYPYPYMQQAEPSPFVPTPAGMMLMSPSGEPVSPFQGPPIPYAHPHLPYSAMGHMPGPAHPFMSPQSFGMSYQSYMPRISHGPYGPYFGSPKIEIGQKLSNSIYANSDSLRYDLSSLKEGYSRQSGSPYSSAINSQQQQQQQYSPSSYSSLSSLSSSSSPSSYIPSSLASSPVSSISASSPISSTGYPGSLPNSYQSSDYAQATNGYRQYLNQQQQQLLQSNPQLLYSRISQPYLPYLNNNGPNGGGVSGGGGGGSTGRSQNTDQSSYSNSDYLKQSPNSPNLSLQSTSSSSSPSSSSLSSSSSSEITNNNKNSNPNKEELGFFRRFDSNDNNNQNENDDSANINLSNHNNHNNNNNNNLN